MSPLDAAFMFFFVLITSKVLIESFEFWNDVDSEALINETERRLAHARVSRTKKRPECVTRTSSRPVSVPYRLYSVDKKKSVSVPAPLHGNRPVRRGVGRQIEKVA